MHLTAEEMLTIFFILTASVKSYFNFKIYFEKLLTREDSPFLPQSAVD